MRVADIRKTLTAQPFKPFTLHLADGRSFHIDHPDFMFLPPPAQRIAVIYSKEDDGIEIIDPTLVTSLTIEKSKGNGRKKKAG